MLPRTTTTNMLSSSNTAEESHGCECELVVALSSVCLLDLCLCPQGPFELMA